MDLTDKNQAIHQNCFLCYKLCGGCSILLLYLTLAMLPDAMVRSCRASVPQETSPNKQTVPPRLTGYLLIQIKTTVSCHSLHTHQGGYGEKQNPKKQKVTTVGVDVEKLCAPLMGMSRCSLCGKTDGGSSKINH